MTIEGAGEPADDQEPFSVGIDSTNTPITEGETLEVSVDVTNPGTTGHTETLTLTLGDTVRDSREVELPGGDSQSVTLIWETMGDDKGEYTAVVASEADQATREVAVTEATDSGSVFTVSIEDVSTPTDGQQEFEANVIIENTGAADDTQTVTLTSEGTDRASRDVTLSSGQSRTVTFTWEQEAEDGLTIEVASETDSDTSEAVLQDETQDEQAGEGVPSTQIAGTLVLILVLVAGYYVRRRQQSKRDTDADNGTPANGEDQPASGPDSDTPSASGQQPNEPGQ